MNLDDMFQDRRCRETEANAALMVSIYAHGAIVSARRE